MRDSHYDGSREITITFSSNSDSSPSLSLLRVAITCDSTASAHTFASHVSNVLTEQGLKSDFTDGLKALFEGCEKRHMKAGDMFVAAGSMPSHIAFVIQGRFAVSVNKKIVASIEHGQV